MSLQTNLHIQVADEHALYEIMPPLAALLASYKQQRAGNAFFYMIYDEGGLHIRLCLLATSAATVQKDADALAAYLQVSGQVTELVEAELPIPFPPFETAESWQLAIDHFSITSEVMLELWAEELYDYVYDRALGMAFQLQTALVLAFFPNEQGSAFLQTYATHWLPAYNAYADAPVEQIDAFQSLYDAASVLPIAKEIYQMCEEAAFTDDRLARWFAICQHSAKTIQDALPDQKSKIAAAFLHRCFNQLDIHNADESLLAYQGHRALMMI